jgi:hypothetical protein
MQVNTQRCYCPYCGESIEILVDDSVEQQNYIEDCSVCCCPIVFTITADPVTGDVDVQALSENE